MNLVIDGVGKLRESEIEVNGITVIAGENNVGKSTVSEALFALFNALYNLENREDRERVESIRDAFSSVRSTRRLTFMRAMRAADRFLADNLEYTECRGGSIATKRSDLKCKVSTAFSETTSEILDEDALDALVDRIINVLSVSDDDIVREIIQKSFDSEFSGQINNIFNPENATVALRIRDQRISLSFSHNKLTNADNTFSFHTRPIYIDDPFVLDSQRPFGYRGQGHRVELWNDLFRAPAQDSVIGSILDAKSLDRIMRCIGVACDGEMVNDRSGVGFRISGSTEVLDMANLSAGLKTFVIFKILLENGFVEQGGVLILDEPENHLHPKWQLLLAEIIVLIQREFNMHILMNTHSPYFLNAIEAYSNKYGICKRCNYYLAESDGRYGSIRLVTGKTEQIYHKLAEPFQMLEDVEDDE